MSRRSDRAPRLPRSGPGRALEASFAVSSHEAAALLPTPVSGIHLGAARDLPDPETEPGDPVRVPLRLELFGPRPREVVVLGHPEVGRLLTLRAAACGAAVAVGAADTRPWEQLLAAVGGETGFATLVAPGQAVLPPAPDQPLLLVVDGLPPDALVVPEGRRSTLWLADPASVETLEPVLARADVLILGQGQADVVTRGLELAGAAPRLGTMMSALAADEVLVSAAQAAAHPVRITASDVERLLLNLPVPGAFAP